jgi:carbamoyl-phosphate synthase/aspartate carbamoyltransferase
MSIPPCLPVTFSIENNDKGVLILEEGSSFQGYSFGSNTPISGECVFQTGMVGYPESLTDPSYRGQILVLTFPLIGNYGVPSASAVERSLNNLPKYFESNHIHIAGLIVGHYANEYSHYLARSSLSDWLKAEGIPALFSIDTRALTKKIRDHGSMLGKIMFPIKNTPNIFDLNWLDAYHSIEWSDPNKRNLVQEGMYYSYFSFNEKNDDLFTTSF